MALCRQACSFAPCLRWAAPSFRVLVIFLLFRGPNERLYTRQGISWVCLGYTNYRCAQSAPSKDVLIRGRIRFLDPTSSARRAARTRAHAARGRAYRLAIEAATLLTTL